MTGSCGYDRELLAMARVSSSFCVPQIREQEQNKNKTDVGLWVGEGALKNLSFC